MALLYALTIFVGSCLLFVIQPLCAKMVLPHLGGTPAVWNTCIVFFQAGLLGGYAYAHVMPHRLGRLRHAVLHVVLLVLALLVLPVDFPPEVPGDWHPVAWLLLSLMRTAALP